MLKKMVAALLLASLAAGLMLPALAENRDLFLQSAPGWEGGQVFSAAALDGTLYVLRNDGIFAVAPGAEPRKVYDTSESLSAGGDGQILVTQAGPENAPAPLPPTAAEPVKEGDLIRELPPTAAEPAKENAAEQELPPQAQGPGQALLGQDKPKGELVVEVIPAQPNLPVYVNHLFSDGERLYGLQADAGTLYTLEQGGDGMLTPKESVKLEVQPQSFEGGEEYVMQDTPEQYLLDGGRLFVITRNYLSGRGEPTLAAWDLQTGKKTGYEFPFVLRISSYKDGKLLALVLNEEDAWNPETGTMKSPDLYAFDPEKGTGEKLGVTTLPYRGGDSTALAYDKALDMIYLLAPSKIFRRDAAGREELAAYLSTASLWGVAADKLLVIQPGVVAAVGMEGVFIREADPAKLPAATLTLYGGWEDETFKRAAAMMPEVPVTFLDSKYFPSAQELGQALVSGEDAIDVFMLSTVEMDIDNLIAKGYTLDLSTSSVISKHVDRLYPFLQQLARRDGAIQLVPLSVQAGDTVTAYADNFKEIGIEIPRDFPAFARFLGDWATEKAEQYPDFIPVSDPDTSGVLFNVAMQLYINGMAARGEELRFDTPDFRTLMGQVQEAAERLGDTAVDWSSPDINERMNAFFAKKSLMDFSGGMDLLSFLSMPTSGMGTLEPVFLSLKEGEEGMPGFSVTAMFVNPRSKNPELAMRFVENYVSSLSPASLAAMDPAMNDPVPNPEYDRMLKSTQENRASLQEAYDKAAEGPEKEELRKNLESFDKTVMAETESFRYLVTDKAIQTYRDLAGRSHLLGYGTTRFWRSEELNSLLGRLRGKQISLEQFIQEADGKLRLMRLENQ